MDEKGCSITKGTLSNLNFPPVVLFVVAVVVVVVVDDVFSIWLFDWRTKPVGITYIKGGFPIEIKTKIRYHIIC